MHVFTIGAIALFCGNALILNGKYLTSVSMLQTFTLQTRIRVCRYNRPIMPADTFIRPLILQQIPKGFQCKCAFQLRTRVQTGKKFGGGGKLAVWIPTLLLCMVKRKSSAIPGSVWLSGPVSGPKGFPMRAHVQYDSGKVE